MQNDTNHDQSSNGRQYSPYSDLLGEKTVTWQCAVAANDIWDESDPEFCDHESEEIELDEPAYRVDDGKIYVPGRPLECPECGNPAEFEFNGVSLVFGV